MSNAANNTAAKEEEFKFDITVPEKRPLVATVPTELTTTKSLCEDINKLFSVYRDYKGCRIVPVINKATGQIALETMIYFQQGASLDGCAEAFIPNEVPSKEKGSFIEVLRARENVGRGKKYSITKEGEYGIGKYIDARAKKNSNWVKTCITESANNGFSGYGAVVPTTVLITVKHISLLSIIQEICGTEEIDEDGKNSRLWYQITPLRQVATGADENWLVQVSCIHEDRLKELGDAVGAYFRPNNSPIMVERS